MELICKENQTEAYTDSTGIKDGALNDRLKFWEIDCFFKCPVVGMCLTFSEQKRLLKKSDFSYKNSSPFGIHEKLVASAQSENPLSKRIDALVDRKYGKQAQALLMLEEREFMARFESAFEKGEITEIYWAAAVHPYLSFESKRRIVGKVHMTMHKDSEQTMKLKQKLEARAIELERGRKTTRAARQNSRDLKKENQRLTGEIREVTRTSSNFNASSSDK